MLSKNRSTVRGSSKITKRTESKAVEDGNDSSHASQTKGFATCHFALTCDLRPEIVVKVFEQERQKCSTDIVKYWGRTVTWHKSFRDRQLYRDYSRGNNRMEVVNGQTII